MLQVKKRDDSLTEFKIDKIKTAIHKAFKGLKKRVHPDVLDLIALRSVADFDSKVVADIISVEDIQDSVEHVLSECGYSQVAKAYILYRREHQRLREIEEVNNHYLKNIENYLQADNKTSIGALVLNNSAMLTKLYWLEDVYDQTIREAIKSGEIEIDGLNMLAPYTCFWDLQSLLNKGIISVHNKVGSLPAKHLSTACLHMANFISIMQNEWVNFTIFAHVDTLLAPYVRKDKLRYSEIKQAIQTLIYDINMPSLGGDKEPLSHFIFDHNIPFKWHTKKALIANEEQTYTYGDLTKEAREIRLAFYEVLLDGDGKGQPFAYPWLTVNQIEKELLPLLRQQQTIFWQIKPSYLEEQMIYAKAIISYQRDNWHELYNLVKKALLMQKKVINNFFTSGLYPYTKAYGMPQKGYSIIQWQGISDNDIDHFLKEIQKDIIKEKEFLFAFKSDKQEDIMQGLALQKKSQVLDGIGKLQSINIPKEMMDQDIQHYLKRIQSVYHLNCLGFNIDKEV